MNAEPFRPILAIILLHGHLQVEDSDMLLGHFGNLPAYVLEFMVAYLRQTNRGFILPWFSTPRRPYAMIQSSTRAEDKRQI